MAFWQNIQGFIQRVYPRPGVTKQQGLAYWHEQIFYYMGICFMLLGLFMLVPSVIVAIRINLYIIVLVDSIIFTLLLFLFIKRPFSIKTRMLIISGFLYLLSNLLIIYFGPYGAGLVWLFCLPIVVALFFDTRYVIISLVAIVASFVGLGYCIKNQVFPNLNIAQFNADTWIATSVNVIILDSFLSLSIVIVLAGLSKTIVSQKSARNKLFNQKLALAKAKDKAEESERLKSAFLANMSHEIRTPMNGILGFAELLKNPKLDKDRQLYYINIINERGHYLMQIINDILDISKIESGQLELEPEVFDLVGFLKELESFFLLNPDLMKKGIDFALEIPGDKKSLLFDSDKNRLNQILTNLLANAIKYTPHGKIRFGFELVENKSLRFYVTDTGIGISREDQHKVFQRFQQADDSLNRQYGGTGLGLTISDALVNILGGKMELSSEPGKGSEFYFTLPYHPVMVKDDPGDDYATKNFDFSGFHILVVEDDDTSYTLLKELLEPTKIKYTRAKSGKETMIFLENHGLPDIILMDIQLPDESGIELTKKIRKQDKHVPVIAHTALVNLRNKDEFKQADFTDLIIKPSRPEHILERLAFVLDPCIKND